MRRFKSLPFLIPVLFALFVGGTSFMPRSVYSSWWWFSLWALVAVMSAVLVMKSRMWKRPSLFAMHLSIFVMLAGGGVTALTSVRGTLHLRPFQAADTFIDENGEELPLPATLTLVSFSQEYYAGMTFPKDFHSEVISSDGHKMNISMNKIGKLYGYRFYQTSFDDEGGTVLTVSHDPAGIAITYFGFLLFAVSGAIIVVGRFVGVNSGWGRRIAMALVLSASACGNSVSATPAISREAADSLAVRPVLFNGNVVTFNTAATQIAFKLTGKSSVGSLSPEQFVASLILYRNEWSEVAFIKIKDRTLRQALGADGDYVSINSLYDIDNSYIPGKLYCGGRGALDDAILRLDEKVAVVIGLWNGTLFTPAGEKAIYHEFRVKAEILYNRMSPVLIEFIISIILAVISIVFLLIKRPAPLWKFMLAGAVAGCLVMVWRWYISGSFPISDVSQMMQFLATVVALLTVIIAYRNYSPLLAALTQMSAAFLFLVSWLGIKDPQLSPLMPVLASPWLAIHVSIVMTAYAILGFTLPVAVVSVILSKERSRLSALSVSMLMPGTYLLGIGIIVGALWANVSWGRYWAWDPKETWALVTLILYSIPQHRKFRTQLSPLAYNIYIIFAFLSILMTYGGVNCMSSLHSYN